MQKNKKIRIGLRKSKLSKLQTSDFIDKFLQSNKDIFPEDIEQITISTKGDIHKSHRLDKIGGKGLFVKEIEDHIIEGDIHLGVHSVKDLPSQENNKLKIVCWLERLMPNDVLISNSNKSLKELKKGSVVGTSSIRRRAQLLNFRKDLSVKLLRGNVDTRISKLRDGNYDAIILSHAGLKRLGLENEITEILPLNLFLPPACQGAVGVQSINNNEWQKLFENVNHDKTEKACLVEREFLKTINANCNSPVSVFAEILDEDIKIQSQLMDHDGVVLFNDTRVSKIQDGIKTARSLGLDLISKIGKEKIKKLDNLEDDFDYAP
tara:strand:- start:116 stop:1078 length:963 start_codon:yes stop_codon:yes gene_type:complete